MAVLGVLVTLKDRAGQVLVLQEHIEVAGLLGCPIARRICRARRDPDSPSADVDENQEIQIGHFFDRSYRRARSKHEKRNPLPKRHFWKNRSETLCRGRSVRTGLFRPYPIGSRHGKLVLVQVNTHADPEDGGRYTVKKYQSTKRLSDNGWEHESIELQPLNPDPKFKPIKITADDADSMRIIGEFVAVLSTNPK